MAQPLIRVMVLACWGALLLQACGTSDTEGASTPATSTSTAADTQGAPPSGTQTPTTALTSNAGAANTEPEADPAPRPDGADPSTAATDAAPEPALPEPGALPTSSDIEEPGPTTTDAAAESSSPDEPEPHPGVLPEAPADPEPAENLEPDQPVVAPDDRSAEGTCARWNADRASLSEGTWSGSIDACDPGDISAEGRDNALAVLNLYRWLADLPEVATDPERNELAQACALMMHANRNLSHEPPMDWQCYSDSGAQGARTSNISGGPGVQSVDLYLLDRGNESTMGHRRIILSNSFGPVGLGSTGPGGYSCMQNNNGSGDAQKAWQAWPPPGVFPMQGYEFIRTSLSDTGWSVQGERLDFSNIDVQVTLDGAPADVDVSQLEGNYGGTRGVRIVPVGWSPRAGQTVGVSLTGTDETIEYEVEFVDCSE